MLAESTKNTSVWICWYAGHHGRYAGMHVGVIWDLWGWKGRVSVFIKAYFQHINCQFMKNFLSATLLVFLSSYFVVFIFTCLTPLSVFFKDRNKQYMNKIYILLLQVMYFQITDKDLIDCRVVLYFYSAPSPLGFLRVRYWDSPSSLS